MAMDPSQDGWTRALLGLEWSTIVAGVFAAMVLLVKRPAVPSSHSHDRPAIVLQARSACTGASGTLNILRAYLDGAELPADPSAPEPVLDETMRARGAELFTKHCATCHGLTGDGSGPTARELAHPPANLTTGTYELRTTEHEALPADIDMFRTITRGVHGTGMPPWFALPERDRWALAAHLKTLSRQFQEDEAPPAIVVSTPTVTPERIARGQQLYGTAGCASCHGKDGRGDGPAASSLTYQSSGLRASPRDFRIGRFHRGTRLADLYLTIVTGLDGTPMASFAKVLLPDELWDAAMYVHSLVPPITVFPNGLRCPQLAAEVRCFDLLGSTKCLEPTFNADELAGIRMLVYSLQPTP
ncbi:MAG TPA: c-type cytochrome [Kofleriaceae bacterium]|jgi:mono/diheme cytochrome c family protein|nr:c-type cytochrome [Kofleriaceae bacterium]